MKKLVLITVCLMFVLSCSKFCQTSKKGADMVAKAMQSRWGCNYQKVYDFATTPLNYVCKQEDKFTVVGALATAACKVAVDAASSYAAQGMASKFDCKADLVAKDLKLTDNLCSILGLVM